MRNHLKGVESIHMQVFFYLPEQYMPTPETQVEWEKGTISQLQQSGKIASAQCWIYQTWLRLKSSGLDIELVHSLPEQGVTVCLSNCLDEDFRASRDQFIVAVVADFLPHAGAQWQVLQNRTHVPSIPRSTFIPHWPQPNLRARDPARKNTFERLAYFGDEPNLAKELRDSKWRQRLLDSTGVSFEIRAASQWSDYQDVDCALGIRDFETKPHLHKPPTKLYNAWLGHVPFIGGADSAYRSERHSPLDYLEATSPTSVIECVRRLRTDITLRDAMIDNAVRRSLEFTPEAIADRWAHFLEKDLRGPYQEWRDLSSMKRSWFFTRQAGQFLWDEKVRR